MKDLIRKKPAAVTHEALQHEAGPCPNCGRQMGAGDQFCPSCGQKHIGEEEMSFRHLVGESFLDYFHFDSKFFRTLLPLIFRPGFLTMEFMKGKRRSYVEPFKLFLVVSVIYFLLLPLSNDRGTDMPEVSAKSDSTLAGPAKSPVSFRINGKVTSQEAEDSLRRELKKYGPEEYVNRTYKNQGWFTRLFLRQAFKILLRSGNSFMTVLEHTASKMVFLLIPLFALILKLLYRKKGRLYYEHLIFSLHFHAFFFLVMILMLIVELFVRVSLPVVTLVSLFYLFVAMKRNYGETAGKTLGRFLLQILIYAIAALPVFFLILILVAALIY